MYDFIQPIRGAVSKVTPTEAPYTPTDEASVLTSLGVSWWYDYLPSTTVTVAGAKYYPSIYNRTYFLDGTSLNAAAAAAIANGTGIITYNEPDLSTGANVSVSQALADWPTFVATGAKIFAPACATDMRGSAFAPTAWFTQFMAGNPQVDYIAVHYYRDPSQDPVAQADATAVYLLQVFNAWGKPVFLTETGGINFVGGVSTWVFGTPAWEATYLNRLIHWVTSPSYAGWFLGMSPYPLCYTNTEIAQNANCVNIQLADLSKNLTVPGTTWKNAR